MGGKCIGEERSWEFFIIGVANRRVKVQLFSNLKNSCCFFLPARASEQGRSVHIYQRVR